MKTIINLLIMLSIVCCICWGCSPCYKLRTGSYVVKEVRGNTIELKGVEGDWRVPTDTLKPGQSIYVQKVKRRDKATIW